MELAPVLLNIACMHDSLNGKKKQPLTQEQQERLLEMERLRSAMMEKRAKRVRGLQDRHC